MRSPGRGLRGGRAGRARSGTRRWLVGGDGSPRRPRGRGELLLVGVGTEVASEGAIAGSAVSLPITEECARQWAGTVQVLRVTTQSTARGGPSDDRGGCRSLVRTPCVAGGPAAGVQDLQCLTPGGAGALSHWVGMVMLALGNRDCR